MRKSSPCCDGPAGATAAFLFKPCGASIASVAAPSVSPPRSYIMIPFSWEELPGVPRRRRHSAAEHTRRQLSLPPPPAAEAPVRSSPPPGVDPFEVALLKCTTAAEHRKKVAGGLRRTIAQRLGFLGLQGSCMAASSVAEKTVYLTRSGRSAADYPLRRRFK